MKTEVKEPGGSSFEARDTGGAVPGAFVVRHHRYAKGGPPENDGISSYSEHVFRSPLECLDNLRRMMIPEILREASGLAEEADLEVLLDGSGYSVSLVAEELLSMIDECIDSNSCRPRNLDRIKRAYNGLSGFDARVVRRISGWGIAPMSGMKPGRNPCRGGLAV